MNKKPSNKLAVLPPPQSPVSGAKEFSRRRHPGQIRRAGDFHSNLIVLIREFSIDRELEQEAETLADYLIEALKLVAPRKGDMTRLTGGIEVVVTPEAQKDQENLIRILLDALGSPMDDPVSYLQIDRTRQIAFGTAIAQGWTLTAKGWIKMGQ